MNDNAIDTIVIESPRLILRTVTLADINHVALSWKLDAPPISPEDAEKTIRWMCDNHKQNTSNKLVHLCLAIIHKQDGEFIGWCGLDHRNKEQKHPVLFYLLKQAYWQKGFGTEAAYALIDFVFQHLDLEQIDSNTRLDNLASKRIMEKIGLRYLGINEEQGYCFTLTKDEYLEQRSTQYSTRKL